MKQKNFITFRLRFIALNNGTGRTGTSILISSSSQTSGFNNDSDGRFSGDSDEDSMDKTSLESPIFLNRWSASRVASTF
jgi:hypothetical protein